MHKSLPFAPEHSTAFKQFANVSKKLVPQYDVTASECTAEVGPGDNVGLEVDGTKEGNSDGLLLGDSVGERVQSTPAKQICPSGQSSFPRGHFFRGSNECKSRT